MAELLREYSLDTIDLLKLDCEGAEYAILGGNEQLLKDKIRWLAMEYHEVGGHRVHEIQRLLASAAFICETYPQSGWQTGMLYAVNPHLRAWLK